MLWTWIKEGRPAEAQNAAGWSGLLSLPKACRLDVDGSLIVEPAAELTALRADSRIVEADILTPACENPFSDLRGDCVEVEVEFSSVEPTICDLTLRASPDQAEYTRITYHSTEGTLTVDGRRSSLDPEVDHPIVTGPLRPDHLGVVRFRVFLDRSVLEVFLADRACITQRLYPRREDSLGLSFLVREGSVTVRRLSAWKVASIWPDKVRSDAAGG